MNPKQTLDAYIDEYYYREQIDITFIDDNSARLEMPDRIIHLVCDDAGVVTPTTRKRRGIPFSDVPIGIKNTTKQISLADIDIPNAQDDKDDVPFELPIREIRHDFREGDMVACIFNTQQTFRVDKQDDNILYLFDPKTSSSHIVATADVVAV